MRNTPPSHWAVLATAFFSSGFFSGSALANCQPVLDAILKVTQQTRFAAYDVAKPDQVPTGEPEVVVIGRVYYLREETKWQRFEVSAEERDSVLNWPALRKEIAANNVRCKSLGTGTYRGGPVSKIQYEIVGDKDGPNIVWIDRRTGLPVYEGESDGTGVAVLYGDAVKEPRVQR